MSIEKREDLPTFTSDDEVGWECSASEPIDLNGGFPFVGSIVERVLGMAELAGPIEFEDDQTQE